MLNETNCYAQHVDNSAGHVGYKHLMVNELQPVTAKTCVLALFTIMCIVLKYGLR
jgi:hypothetical protein